MDSAQMLQGQQLQQLQLQLRQLELQIQLHQQQLQEPWKVQQQESSQSEAPQQQPPPQPKAQQSAPQQPQQEPGQTQSQQPQEQQKQLATYFTAPEMVSTLDIGYLQELLSANLLAVKQYRQATKDCQLPDLKQQFKEASQMHLQHYNNLLSFLSENGGIVK